MLLHPAPSFGQSAGLAGQGMVHLGPIPKVKQTPVSPAASQQVSPIVQSEPNSRHRLEPVLEVVAPVVELVDAPDDELVVALVVAVVELVVALEVVAVVPPPPLPPSPEPSSPQPRSPSAPSAKKQA